MVRGRIIRYGVLIKANIKRQKGSFIGVLLLLLIITVSLNAVIAIWHNASTYEENQLERLHFGDITTWIADYDNITELSDQIESLDDVEKVGNQPTLYVKGQVNGIKDDETRMIVPYDPSAYDYHIFHRDNKTINDDPQSLKEDEIYAPISFTSLYQTDIGDKITFQINKNQQMTYKIKGFFEDPIMGSTMMGMKTVLMNEDAHKTLTQSIKEQPDKNSKSGYALHIFQSKNSELSINELQTSINEQLEKTNTVILFSYDKHVIISFMLILQDMFAAFLLLFVLVLLVIAFIVLGHNISATIEQDYVDMGILKAIGYTKGDIRKLLVSQYLLTIIIGMILGLLISLPTITFINQITLTSIGILIPSTLPLGLCFIVSGIIILILSAFIIMKTRKIGSIKPIHAIRGGIDHIYFESRFTLPVKKHLLHFWISLRQLISAKRQYISVGIVSILLVFFLSLTQRIGAWTGPNGEGLVDAFSIATSDFGVDTQTGVHEEAITSLINKTSPIDYEYKFKNLKANINDVNYIVNVIDKPQYYHVLEGRTCKYKNEILLTDLAAEDLNIGIGDSVMVTYQNKSEEYIVSGINQCANDMGRNFSMSLDGFRRLTNENIAFTSYYKLKDNTKKENIIQEIKTTFKKQVKIDNNTWSGLDTITSVMNALQTFMLIVVIIFILVAITLTGNKLLFKEKHDLGIYKSLGFSSKHLRISFALRFGIIAMMGSILGIILSAVSTDIIVSNFMRMCGVSNFSSHLSFIDAMKPGIIVTGLFILFAYIESRHIKKADPKILISE